MEASTLASGLVGKDDLPLQEAPPGILGFSEGIYFVGHDAANGISFWTACHPSEHDFGLVREMFAIYLPDGRYLFSKTWGRGRRPGVVGGSVQSFECTQPFVEWHLTFDGMVQAVPQAATLDGPVADGRRTPARFDAEITAASPVLLPLDERGETLVAQRTFEATQAPEDLVPFWLQLVTFTASLTLEGETIELSGTGVRDHSRGGRHFGNFHSHELMSGMLDDGSGFALLRASTLDGKELAFAHVVRPDGGVQPARVLKTPSLDRLMPKDEPVEVVLATAGGEYRVTGRTLNNAGQTLLAPNDLLFGVDRSDDANLALLHAFTELTGAGANGIGFYERSRMAAEVAPQEAIA